MNGDVRDEERPAELSPRGELSGEPGTAGSGSAVSRTATQLALEYLAVADSLSRRFRTPGHDPEDLRQVARLALLKAAHRYRASLGHGFVQYAVPTINGELKRYLRDQSWAVRPPRSLQELRLRINGLRQQLTQQLGHEPSPAELGEAAGASSAEVVEAQTASAAMTSEPLDRTDTANPDRQPLAAVLGFEDPGFEQVEDMELLSGALSGLSRPDKRLLFLRFVEEMTQEEIARELGVSQMQVSRLLARLIDRIRRNTRF